LVSFISGFWMGKSSWVPSRTEGLFLTCCRWSDLLWVLQILPPPCRRWGLDRRARSLIVILPEMLLLDMTSPSNILKPMTLCTELCCFRETNLVSNNLFWTSMDIIRMLLVKCCNRRCVVLNHTILVCMSKVVWNPSRFLDYRDYGILSTGIWSLRWLFLYLRSCNLVGSVTLRPCKNVILEQYYILVYQIWPIINKKKYKYL
jgi:hypothetical protein